MQPQPFSRVSISICVLMAGFACYGQSPVPLNPVPTRIVGHPLPEQLTLSSFNPNLVEGREMFSPEGIALDTSVTPPILYISDTGNNRVLAWKNALNFTNGQIADLWIGQQDQYRTLPQGPGQTFATGLNAPTGLAVDANGNLYVADNGNNRILRFRKPFANPSNQTPDLWLGQPNLNSRSANLGASAPSAQGLSLTGRSSLTFDSSGNLWVTDPGNRRVLRFSGASVASGGGPLSANLVLGQLSFGTPDATVTFANRTTANLFATPVALAFDSNGRLYVADAAISGTAFSRVLVFVPSPQFTNGMSAARIMGVLTGAAPSQEAGMRTIFGQAAGIFFLEGKVGVLDTGYSRILLFDSFEKWPDANTTFSPLATTVAGQNSYLDVNPNASPSSSIAPAASPSAMYQPTAAVFSGSELFVADTLNHRAVVLPLAGGSFGAATRVLGQDRFDMRAPNLIEGREFNFTGSGTLDGGVAVDYTSDTPHLYVADTYNHRVLGFSDYRKVKAGARADLILGQVDMNSALINITGDPDKPTQSSLRSPTGLLVDPNGNLYVADTGNGRVLRFPAPFAHLGQLSQADLVLGQSDFTSEINEPTASRMGAPYGLAWGGDKGLLVSDLAYNRILLFPFSSGGTFNAGTDNGKAASKVIGQPDFNTIGSGNSLNSLSAPHHIATDAEGHVYAADTGNNRIAIFDQVTNLPDKGAIAAVTIPGLSRPQGIFINQFTGDSWVAEVGSNSGLVRRYPKYVNLIFNTASNGSIQTAGAPMALTLDQYGNLLVADGTNRVSFYFPGLQGVNGSSFLGNRPLAPGVFASICSTTTTGASSNCDPATRQPIFGTATATKDSVPNPLPYPKTLGDTQVLFTSPGRDPIPAPLTYVSPDQVNFVVPWSAPTSGTADVQVVQASTGRVYAAATVALSTVSPGIFTQDFAARGFRQAAVINTADNTVNSPTNPAARGTYISIYATGQGLVPNPPADGDLPQGLVSTPLKPLIFMSTCFLDSCAVGADDKPRDEWLQFSGLSPNYPGVWQINVYVPKIVPPGNQVPLAIVLNGVPNWDGTSGFQTTIAVK